MQPDQQLYMARLRKADGSFHLTAALTIEEIIPEVIKRLPCDILYSLVPNGSGFVLQPEFVFTLDVTPFQPVSPQSSVRPQVEPPALSPQQEAALKEMQAINEDEYPLKRIKDNNTPQGMAVKSPNSPQDGFVFEGAIPTKTQQELLAERGLEQPIEVKPKKKARKAKVVKEEIPDNDDDLPPPPPRGHVKITSFSTATPAEALAASKQIFK